MGTLTDMTQLCLYLNIYCVISFLIFIGEEKNLGWELWAHKRTGLTLPNSCQLVDLAPVC